jgi:phenylpropionate dioxygenase-like ring-hydroxylating dioxygenase large terminal subunit
VAIEPLVEIPPGQGARSSGPSFQDLLDLETRPVPGILREQSARDIPCVKVPISRYTSRAFHDLEVEKLWKKVWQFACREEQIPEPGDHVVYDVADLSLVVVRGDDRRIRAFHNACLHRGRALKDFDGRSAELRCPFHGWTWKLDGRLARLPCRWDLPHVSRDDYALPQARVGTWGGFVFVNMDPDCEPLERFLGELPRHFERWPLEDRYIQAHVAKRMRCNWKVCQEAFMEAYHVVATHPQLLAGIGDANSQYDAWDTFSRAITPNMTPSPHLAWQPSEQEQLDAFLGIDLDGPSPIRVPEGMTARQTMAQGARSQIEAMVPSAAGLTDAELVDALYYTLFPNFHPWGGYIRITYRFRPDRNEPDRSIMDVFLLAPFAGERPPPAKTRHLDLDEPWIEARGELGPLADLFMQDAHNLPQVQKGLAAAQHDHVTFARYQETKIRHFHALLEKVVNAGEGDR